MTTKLRNICLFYILVIVIAPVLYVGIVYLTYGNHIFAIIITSVIIIPLLFIEGIVRYVLRKTKEKKQKFLICPRCNILVDIESGICSKCGIKL